MSPAGLSHALFPRRIDAAHVAKLLIVRDDRIGDVILTLPLATALKSARPDLGIHFLVRGRTAPLVREHPHVDAVIELPDLATPPRTVMRAALEAVARERFDLAIVVHSTPAMARLVWDAGVPLRQGNALRTHSWRYNVPVYQRRRVPAKHELDYNLDLVRPYVPVPERSGVEFHLRWSEAADRTVATFLGERNVGRFMIVHPGSGGSAVDLPVETLAAWIADYPYAGQFILTGTAAEKSLVDALASNCRKPVVATAGRFSLEELAALISRAECFISNSTGPLHIARALGRPLLGFYTTVPACHPKRWGPYGWERTHVLLPPGESFDHFEPNKRKSIANMARVTPAMITAALERIGQTP